MKKVDSIADISQKARRPITQEPTNDGYASAHPEADRPLIVEKQQRQNETCDKNDAAGHRRIILVSCASCNKAHQQEKDGRSASHLALTLHPGPGEEHTDEEEPDFQGEE